MSLGRLAQSNLLTEEEKNFFSESQYLTHFVLLEKLPQKDIFLVKNSDDETIYVLKKFYSLEAAENEASCQEFFRLINNTHSEITIHGDEHSIGYYTMLENTTYYDAYCRLAKLDAQQLIQLYHDKKINLGEYAVTALICDNAILLNEGMINDLLQCPDQEIRKSIFLATLKIISLPINTIASFIICTTDSYYLLLLQQEIQLLKKTALNNKNFFAYVNSNLAKQHLHSYFTDLLTFDEMTAHAVPQPEAAEKILAELKHAKTNLTIDTNNYFSKLIIRNTATISDPDSISPETPIFKPITYAEAAKLRINIPKTTPIAPKPAIPAITNNPGPAYTWLGRLSGGLIGTAIFPTLILLGVMSVATFGIGTIAGILLLIVLTGIAALSGAYVGNKMQQCTTKDHNELTDNTPIAKSITNQTRTSLNPYHTQANHALPWDKTLRNKTNLKMIEDNLAKQELSSARHVP
jgi:hypothetical protein